MRPRGILGLIVAISLAAPQSVNAQEAGQPAQGLSRRAAPRGIRILVLDGQDAVNSLASRSAASPAVQVFDFSGAPVEGAVVTFEAPASGPGGTFDNQQTSFTTRTDARGQAVTVFTPNTLPGSFVIRVTARFENETASAAIRQTNSGKAMSVEYKPTEKKWYKSWVWWTIIGAGAGAGGYFAYRSISDSSNPTISLAPGAITIGGPR